MYKVKLDAKGCFSHVFWMTSDQVGIYGGVFGKVQTRATIGRRSSFYCQTISDRRGFPNHCAKLVSTVGVPL